jgi:hypothetical protein
VRMKWPAQATSGPFQPSRGGPAVPNDQLSVHSRRDDNVECLRRKIDLEAALAFGGGAVWGLPPGSRLRAPCTRRQLETEDHTFSDRESGGLVPLGLHPQRPADFKEPVHYLRRYRNPR